MTNGNVLGDVLGLAVGVYVLNRTGVLDNKNKMTFRSPIRFEPIKPLGFMK